MIQLLFEFIQTGHAVDRLQHAVAGEGAEEVFAHKNRIERLAGGNPGEDFLEQAGVAAVLDWEMAVLGNPVQDLAWFNYLDATFAEGLGMPRLEGLPDYTDTVARWENASGYSARDYDYYQIFAGMRYGLILSRIMLATGQTNDVQTNFACQLLQKTMDRLS